MKGQPVTTIAQPPTYEDLTAALVRLLEAQTGSGDVPESRLFDHLRSQMFFVLYLVSINGDGQDETLVHGALVDRPARVFAAASSAIDALWRKATGLPETCDV